MNKAELLMFLAKWCNPQEVRRLVGTNEDLKLKIADFQRDMEKLMEAEDGHENISEDSRDSKGFAQTARSDNY